MRTILIILFIALPLSVPLEASPEAESAGLATLRIGIMPAVDSAPLIVAEAEGFFADEGLEVELAVFRSQLNREAALQAGSIDATVSDLVNAIRAWDNGADYRVVTATQGIFSLVVSPSSGIADAGEWPGLPRRVATGLLEDSIIYYTAVRMMEEAGLDPATIEIVPTLQIPLRVELLLAGELEAAVLPEPVTRLATAKGGRIIVDSTLLSWTPGIVIATGTALREKPRELEALLRAYNRGVVAINRNPDSYRSVIVEGAALPPQTTTTMALPTYLPVAVPPAGTCRRCGRVDDIQGAYRGPPRPGRHRGGSSVLKPWSKLSSATPVTERHRFSQS